MTGTQHDNIMICNQTLFFVQCIMFIIIKEPKSSVGFDSQHACV